MRQEKSKFYIATGLRNVAQHNELRDSLVAAGFEITYDWTKHGPVWSKGKERIRDVAVLERTGVREADFVVVIVAPAEARSSGRGTHAELGMALAYNVPVIVQTDDMELMGATDKTCAFYHDPNVMHSMSPRETVVMALALTFEKRR